MTNLTKKKDKCIVYLLGIVTKKIVAGLNCNEIVTISH